MDPSYMHHFPGERGAETAAQVKAETAAAAPERPKYSIADQPARFAKDKEEGNVRVIDIDFAGYNPESFSGKRVLVTGATRGLGLALAQELARNGAIVIAVVRKANPCLRAALASGDRWRGLVPGHQVIEGIDVTDTVAMEKLTKELTEPVDVVINNAGYFYGPKETIDALNFDEQLKMIDICAIGPLRVTSAMFNAGLLKKGAKVAMITSQGGSIEWRDTQCPKGGDYGHHMSKAAANMMGKLLSNEMKEKGIVVANLHPGFFRTDMTSKYSHIWDIEGAVDVWTGAKRVLHEVKLMDMSTSGQFINCEDGLQIPW